MNRLHKVILEDKNKYKKYSLLASNEKELVSIVVSENSGEVTIVRQSSGRISRDIYRLERI